MLDLLLFHPTIIEGKKIHKIAERPTYVCGSEVLHGGKRPSSIARHDLPLNLFGLGMSSQCHHSTREWLLVSWASHPGYPSASYVIPCQTYAYFIPYGLRG
jgi:hypothetical protein